MSPVDETMTPLEKIDELVKTLEQIMDLAKVGNIHEANEKLDYVRDKLQELFVKSGPLHEDKYETQNAMASLNYASGAFFNENPFIASDHIDNAIGILEEYMTNKKLEE